MLFGLGLASIAGGVALQWKRPFFAGIAAFLANLLLLLTEPEGSVVQWVAFGGLGVVMMVVGLWAEQHRSSLTRWWQLIERWD